MMKFNRNDSVRWMNHAIAYYDSLGKKQKELAIALNMDESRISEIKNAKAKMPPNLMNKIIELCGAPKNDPGRFEVAEIYDSLDSFFDQFIPVTRNIWCREVLRELSCDSIVNRILKGCGLNDGNKDNLIYKINKLVRDDCFSTIASDSKMPLTIASHELSIADEETFHRLRQLNQLIKELPEFEIGDGKVNSINLIVPKVPIVLTGNRIAAFMPDSTIHSYPVNKTVETELKNIIVNTYCMEEKIPQPELWKSIRIEVYLSEMMNYHILIHMSRTNMEPLNCEHSSNVIDGYDWCNYDAVIEGSDRFAVIKNINTLDLFNQIEELRKWQGLDEDNLIELKRNIAKSGGHIPGVLVLS